MNFFDHQEKARKKTFRLVLYFIVAIVLIILAIDVIVVTAIVYTNPEYYFTSFTHDQSQGILIQDRVLSLAIVTSTFVIPGVLIVILTGTLFKMLAIRNGGISVAEMVNAKPIEVTTKDPLEKRFVNVVEEMSIASGIAIPKLYVMEDEMAINAFVAGFKPADTVMVVTKGALNTLNRDELQGVVGHEFSHIFNSDMQINLKLIGILGGLLVLGQTGYFILRIFRGNSRSNSKSDGRVMIIVMAIGVGLLVVGYIGLFFGRLIKAAISRQRELLADASSVAYTRNPQGLVNALQRIELSATGTQLNSKNSEDISHLCFCPSLSVMFSNLLATHPPLKERIRLIDPKGQYAIRKKTEVAPKVTSPLPPTPEPAIKPFDMMATVAVLGATAGANTTDVIKSIGNPTETNILVAKEMLAQIPENILTIAHQPEHVILLIYALVLLPTDGSENLIKVLKQYLSQEEAENVLTLQSQILTLPKTMQLPLLEISLPTFKSISLEEKQKALQAIENILSLKNEGLFQFALHAIISKAVNTQPNKAKYQDFKPVLNDITVLLILVITSGHDDPQKITYCYEKSLKYFTDRSIPQPGVSNFDPVQLQLILSRLNQLAPFCKEKLLKACLECISDDNIIHIQEAELVRAIAACLDCPIPPIVPTAI